jgi:type IV pilus assembly protein PilA
MLMKMRSMMRKEDNQKGFTLVELIIVMAILAVLAAVAIPKYNGVLNKSKQDANDNNVYVITHAAELYYDSNKQTMPASVDALVTAGFLKANPVPPVAGSGSYSITSAGAVLTVIPGLCVGGVPAVAGTAMPAF